MIVLSETTRPKRAAAPRQGASYVRETPQVHWAFLLLSACSAFGIVMFQTLAPIYATDHVASGSAGYGALVAAWGGGAVLEALAVAIAGRTDTTRVMVAGAIGMAIVLGLLGLNHSAVLSFPLAAAIGFGQVVMLQNVNLSVQTIVPNALRGRVMGIYVMIQHGSNPLGAMLAGIAAEFLGVGTAFVIGAVVVTAASGVVGWRLSIRS
jgi:Bacterial protein of unknown function (DUF894).